MVKRRCAALGCVSTEDSEGVTFHCFPTRDEQRRLWLEALGAPSLTARRVCSLHFDQSAFKSTPDPPKTAGLKRRRLRCDAIPMPGASNSAAAEQATEDASEESLVAAELDEDAVMSPAEDFHESGPELTTFDHGIGANVEIAFDHIPGLEMCSESPDTTQFLEIGTVTGDHTYCKTNSHRSMQTDEVPARPLHSKSVQAGVSLKRVVSKGTQTESPSLPYACCTQEGIHDFGVSGKHETPRCSTPNAAGAFEIPKIQEPSLGESFLIEPAFEPPIATARSDHDVTYEPSFGESFIDESASEPPMTERKFIVFESSLLALFKVCGVCQAPCKVSTAVCGSMLRIDVVCPYQHKLSWHSQPRLKRKPVGSLILCAAICFSGASPEKTLRLLKQANIQVPSTRMYYTYQRVLFQPAIQHVWEAEQNNAVQNLNGSAELAGDGRCDSPGFCAKFMTYTFMEVVTSKIIHFVQVQLGENEQVKTSNAMEKYGLVKGLDDLKSRGVTVTTLTTDRHPAIKKHMKINEPNIDHRFDTWHVAKMIKKRLTAESKKAACAALGDWVQPVVNHLYWCAAVSAGDGQLLVAVWKSMINHVINVHSGHGDAYPRCLHNDIQNGKWLLPGTPAYARLVAVTMDKALLRDIERLSSFGQTYSLESYHSLIIRFAPKSVAFTPEMMRARTQLAALHQNENAGRVHAVTASGEPKWKRKMLRAKKGEEVVCPVKTKTTYAYVAKLIEEMLDHCAISASFKKAENEHRRSSAKLPMVQLNETRRPKAELVTVHQSRFSRHTLPPSR